MAQLSEEIKTQARLLLNPTLQFAKQQLEKRGSFHPFAFVVNSAGTTDVRAAYLADDATNDDHYNAILKSLANGAKDDGIVAAFVCRTIILEIDGVRKNALQIHAEHRGGPCISLFYPFVTTVNGEIEFLKRPQSVAVKAAIFTTISES